MLKASEFTCQQGLIRVACFLQIALFSGLCNPQHVSQGKGMLKAGLLSAHAHAPIISLCLRARSSEGCIFISRNSLMAKSRCSRASFFSLG